jgi:hypothetical protein
MQWIMNAEHAGITGQGRQMSEGYSIEIGGEIVGIIVRNEGEREFRFHSAVEGFEALNGRTFRNPAAAERAARELAATRTSRARPFRIRTAA